MYKEMEGKSGFMKERDGQWFVPYEDSIVRFGEHDRPFSGAYHSVLSHSMEGRSSCRLTSHARQ